MKNIVIHSLCLMSLAIISCDKKNNDLDVLWKAPVFNLIDQNGREFSSETLQGKTWIATLFFTTCNGPCPMMAMRLSEIQEAVNLPDLKIVSISCDPVNDTPDSLKKYADQHRADPNRWIFLTGQVEEVRKVADGLKLVFEPALKNEPIMHSTQFLLIDNKGNVRGVYNHDDEESLKQIKIDSAKLAKEAN